VAFRLASWPPPLALTIGESVDAPLSSRPERALLAGKAAGNTVGRALTRGKHCGSAEGLSEPPTETAVIGSFQEVLRHILIFLAGRILICSSLCLQASTGVDGHQFIAVKWGPAFLRVD
jgi:hypothetical protein